LWGGEGRAGMVVGGGKVGRRLDLLPVGTEVARAFLCGVVLGADAGFYHEDVGA